MKTIFSQPALFFSLCIAVLVALLITAAAELLVYAAVSSSYSNAHLLAAIITHL